MTTASFAWIDDTLTLGNGSGTHLADDANTGEIIVSYTSAALLFYIAVTAWRTMSYKLAGAELMQYLWSFGMAWGGAQLLSDVSDDPVVHRDVHNAKLIAYTLLGWGSMYITIPTAINDVLAPRVQRISPVASHILTLLAQFVPTVATMAALTGNSAFTTEQLTHIPLAIVAVTYGTHSILYDAYQAAAANKGMGRAQIVSTALTAATAFTAFELEVQEVDSVLFTVLSMPVAALAFYLVSVDVQVRAGAKVTYVLGMPFLPALPGAHVPQSVGEMTSAATDAAKATAIELGLGTRP
jgi:hypothetical protein